MRQEARFHIRARQFFCSREVYSLGSAQLRDHGVSPVPSTTVRIFSSAGNLRRVSWRVRGISWRAASPNPAGELPSTLAGTSLRVHSPPQAEDTLDNISHCDIMSG